jgi:hypothetical protein
MECIACLCTAVLQCCLQLISMNINDDDIQVCDHGQDRDTRYSLLLSFKASYIPHCLLACTTPSKLTAHPSPGSCLPERSTTTLNLTFASAHVTSQTASFQCVVEMLSRHYGIAHVTLHSTCIQHAIAARLRPYDLHVLAHKNITSTQAMENNASSLVSSKKASPRLQTQSNFAPAPQVGRELTFVSVRNPIVRFQHRLMADSHIDNRHASRLDAPCHLLHCFCPETC